MAVTPSSRQRAEVKQFCAWIEARSAQTRNAIGEAGEDEGSTESD
jgi:hypothetical protein